MLICMYELSLSTLYLHHMCYVVLLAQSLTLFFFLAGLEK